METERIVEFKILSEELNFRKASQRLAMSQSSLSRHIEDLEKQLGFRLFFRDRHQVRLTEEGLKFLSEVADLPDLLQQAIESARPVPRQSGASRVVLGYGRTRGLELVELALASLHAGPSPIELGLVQGGSAEVVQSLLNAELDLALVRPPVPIGLLHSRFLAEELLGAVMREDHLMAAAPTVSIDELLAAPFITVRSRSGIPAVASLSATMKRRDLTPRNIVAEADSITSMFLLVESGLGIGLARQAVFRRAHVPGLVIRTIAPPLPGIPLHLAWRKDPVSPPVGSLMELIVQCRSQLGSGYRIADDI